MSPSHDTDELGFDESEELLSSDVVTLVGADGGEQEFVLLAVVEHAGATYALLTPRSDFDPDGEGDGELLVACYAEDADGTSRFTALEDDAVLDALQDVIADLVGFERSGPKVPFAGPVPEA